MWAAGPDDKWHVGHAINEPAPGPEQLARVKQVDGHKVKLRDGNEWVVPVARSLVGATTLPRALVLGPDRRTWQLRELPEFASLCASAERVWEGITNDEALDFQQGVEIAVAALAVNYRLGPVEASLLGLFGTDEVREIMFALVDWPAVLALNVPGEEGEGAAGGAAGQKKSGSPPAG